MRRRQFVISLGCVAVLACPAVLRAQSAKSVRIGFLGSSSAAGYAKLVDSFRAGLRELGYVEGQNLSIDFRWANGDYSRLPELAEALVRSHVDIIVTHGTPGALAAEHATSTIPIVIAIIGDPVTSGVVASIRDSGRNVTGSSFFQPELTAKRLELIKEAMPAVARVGILSNPDNAVMQSVLQAARQSATKLKIDVQPFAVKAMADAPGAFAAMTAQRIEAVIVPEDGVLITNVKSIVDLATHAKIAAIGFKAVAQSGGLLAYGVNIPQTFRHAATFVDKIVKGAKPQDLPIEQATVFELTINVKTANALGLAVPQMLLTTADEVIE